MKKLTPENISELFPPLLEAASNIWDQEIKDVSSMNFRYVNATSLCVYKPEAFLPFLHCSQGVQQQEEPLYPLMKQLVQCMKQSGSGHWDKRKIVSITLINIWIIITVGPG